MEYQVIEIGNDVIDWATVITKRNTAVHTACTLYLSFLIRQYSNKFFVMMEALNGGFVGFIYALKIHKSSNLTHIESLVSFLYLLIDQVTY